jgi:glycosidase
MINYPIYHEAKSKYAYIYDKDTVHLRLITAKNKTKKIEVIYGDPFFWGPDELDPDKWEWKTQTAESIIMTKEYESAMFDHFFIAIKPEFKRAKYAFIIDDQYLYGVNGIIDLSEKPEEKKNLFGYFNFPYLNEEDIFDAPEWVEDQIWYSIFPERFKNGDPSTNPEGVLQWGVTDKYSNNQRFGGDLRGIIEELPYLKKTGITGIYMTPIFLSNSSHKYDVIDYKQIDPAFGTNETFKELVEKAHELGIKVTLDAVFNHCSIEHPWFLDVIEKGKDSKYFDCFYIIDSDKPVLDVPYVKGKRLPQEYSQKIHENPRLLNYRTFAFTPYMPKLNTSNPLMKEHLLDAALYWIKEYDIDGWRLDVSNEVSHQFWREFRQKVKEAKKDVYIVGENWDNSNPWLKGDQYDAVMNYGILFPIWNYFGTNIDYKQYTSTEFKYAINKVLTDYPKNVLKAMYNLIDSHDTTRIMEICSDDANLVKLPYLFLFTFPGAPSIYYGGEVGLSGKHDPDNRRCMIWDKDKQNQELYPHIRTLIKLRHKYKAFKDTDFEWIEANDLEEYIIFKKEKLYFIISKRYKENTITLPQELQNKVFKDVYHNTVIHTEDSLEIGSYGFYILKEKRH